jgi:hypothetical protein
LCARCRQPLHLSFNPLVDAERFPFRNTFEPFKFRVCALMLAGVAYLAYLVCVSIVPNVVTIDGNVFAIIGIAVGVSLPLMACCGAALYLWLPDFFVKVDRVTMELLLTKTRSGGYLARAPPLRVPLATVRSVEEKRLDTFLGVSTGRTWTIDVALADGTALRLTPQADLTQSRAASQARKLMNAIRMCRGEPLDLEEQPV